MATKHITFPQHATKPTEKPRTIVDIIEDNAGMGGGQIISLINVAFPQATIAEINQALDEHEERLRAESDSLNGEVQVMAEMAALCAPVLERGEASTLGEALKVLADQGDETAARHLALIAGPDQQEFNRLLELAVEADPYWSKAEDGGGYRCKRGARYSTPEDLVEAYRRNHGLEREDSQ